MKLGLLKKIAKEIFTGKGDVPEWFYAFLDPMNEFIEKVGQALQGGLTFEDNFLCKVETVKFTHSTALELNPALDNKKNLRVKGVIPLWAGGMGVDVFKVEQKANGNIAVTFQFDGGSATTTATCTILILLG